MTDQGRQSPRTVNEPLLVPLDFEIERTGRRARTFLLALMLFVTSLIVLLAIAPLREMARAQGTIQPVGEIVELRHVEGGKVRNVFVSQGDRLKRNQRVMQLSAPAVERDLSRLRVRRSNLELRRARYLALLRDEPDLISVATRLSEESSPIYSAEAVQRIQEQVDAERDAFNRQLDNLRNRAEQNRAEGVSRRREAEGLAEEIATYAEQFDTISSLAERGVARRSTALGLKAQRAEANSRYLAIVGEAEAAERSAIGVETEIAQFVAERNAEWIGEAAAAEAEIAELSREIDKLADRVAGLTVRSPIDGVVQAVGVSAAGGVVTPGGLVASIVPVSDKLVAEIRVSPDDIGHIAVGEAASIRVSTFDPEVFGEITGRVEIISPTSFEDESGNRFFQARLALDRTNVDLGERMLSLAPGMVIDAEIRTGAKSVLRYLLKPVIRGLETAFSER